MEKGRLLHILLIFLINTTLIECWPALKCNNDSKLKFDCHPDKAGNTTKLKNNCLKRGCCFKLSSSKTDEPSCFYPNNFNSYTLQAKSCASASCTFMIERAVPSGWPKDINKIRVDVTFGRDIVRIKFTDPNEKRFEVPLVNHFEATSFKVSQFQVDHISSPFGIKITRRSSGATMYVSLILVNLIYLD